MEHKILQNQAPKPIIISWIYNGESDISNPEFTGKYAVHLNLGYKGKLGLCHAPGKQLLLYFFLNNPKKEDETVKSILEI